MLSRACLLLLVLGASGCLHNARLATAREAVETFNAPVKCGPMGFRRVPLQARFGEYVRLTVNAPVALSGTVMVHANGLAHPARVWTSTSGEGLVVEARFENTDPDLPSALRATQPIDVTIADLTAPEGGTCEGAVFTLEHGRLIPPTTDALWLAELERRGGAELAARREARRHMSEEELARANENSQPEFSTVLAGWNEPQQETMTTAAVETDTATASAAEEWAQVNAGDSVAVAQVNVNGQAGATNSAPTSMQTATNGSVAVAPVNVGAASGAQSTTQTVTSGSVAVAQVNVGANSVPTTTETVSSGNVAVAQVNLGANGAQSTTQGNVGANSVPTTTQTVTSGSVAVAQVNVASDFAEYSAAGAYDDANAQRGPALPTVGAAFPPGCTDIACVMPAPQCTNGCTPAPGTCTASSCTVSGQVVELAAYPRGCATNTCAMPFSRCTGACTRAPGVFVNGSYSCPAQQPVVSVAAASTSATVDAEWNAPPSVTTPVAYEVPQTQVIAAPPPQQQVDVAVDIASVLPWFFGAAVIAPAPVYAPAPRYVPPPRYAPAPGYAPGPVHGAVPVGSTRSRR